MPRKPIDPSKPLIPMVRNPATGRYVRLNSKIGKSLLPPKDMMYNETTKRWVKDGSKVAKKLVQHAQVEMKEEHKAEKLPNHPEDIHEIARQLELLRQRIEPLIPPAQN